MRAASSASRSEILGASSQMPALRRDEPRSLPEGSRPSRRPHRVATASYVHFLYSDGIRTVRSSRIARPRRWTRRGCSRELERVDGASAPYTPRTARRALLAWSDGTLHYTLVGESGLVDLRATRRSMGKALIDIDGLFPS